MSPRVFLSYRRLDSAGFSDLLFRSLTEEAGLEVFLDIGSIEPGEPFAQVIDRELGRADLVLALIGPQWERSFDPDSDGPDGRDPREDFVRIELSRALELGRPVLPVLVGGATLPSKAQLPPVLAPMLDRNAITLDRNNWAADTRRLVDHLRGLPTLGRPRRDLRPAIVTASVVAWFAVDAARPLDLRAHVVVALVAVGLILWAWRRPRGRIVGGKATIGIGLAAATGVLLLALSGLL